MPPFSSTLVLGLTSFGFDFNTGVQSCPFGSPLLSSKHDWLSDCDPSRLVKQNLHDITARFPAVARRAWKATSEIKVYCHLCTAVGTMHVHAMCRPASRRESQPKDFPPPPCPLATDATGRKTTVCRGIERLAESCRHCPGHSNSIFVKGKACLTSNSISIALKIDLILVSVELRRALATDTGLWIFMSFHSVPTASFCN